MKVRYANEGDFVWLADSDSHVSNEWVSRCITNKEYLICDDKRGQIGFLRYSFFWGTIPYMDMIFVLENHRRIGVGTALFNFWETKMRESNATILMTSFTAGEEASYDWHRRNGFKKSGQLTFGQLDPTPEIFLVKNL
ncbi:MAG: GNAT family N-acetyltransferase [Phormidesmis sp.]